MFWGFVPVFSSKVGSGPSYARRPAPGDSHPDPQPSVRASGYLARNQGELAAFDILLPSTSMLGISFFLLQLGP